MVWLSVILGLLPSRLLPRVCAFEVPGQCQTHGHSGFENDLEDIESDLLAAFVANDVPAAFCAPEVFVDAAMVAYDYWGLMIGAALSVYDDAAMLCFQKFELNSETGLGRFLELLEVFPDPIAHSGSSICVSSHGILAWMSGVHLVTEMVCCCLGSSCWSMVPVLGAVIGGCYRVGGCLVVATTRAASVELFDMRIWHAAAANVAAFQSSTLNTVQVAAEAPACEYFCNMRKQHAAAASAAALRGTFNFISIWEDVFESAPLVFWIWLSGMVVLCAGFWILFGGKVSSNSLGKGKIRFVQKDVEEPSAPSDLQVLTREELDCFDDEDGELHLHQDHVDFKGKDGARH